MIDLTSSAQNETDAEIVAALRSRPRCLPSRLGYDDAGSRLYAEMMQVPSYYPVRAESELFRKHAAAMMRAADAATVVDLGAGTAEKTELLLRELAGHDQASFIPLDVSQEALRLAGERIHASLPALRVTPVCADFIAGLGWVEENTTQRTLIALLGGTYGNMSPSVRTTLAAAARRAVRTGSFLVCVDLHKTNGMIEAAYDVHDRYRPLRMEFALNRIEHLNRLCDGDLDRTQFAPDTWYDRSKRSVIAILRSTTRQTIHLARLGLTVELDEGEEIIRDVMHKFLPDELEAEVASTGWTLADSWVHERFNYAAMLFEAA